MNVDLSKRWTRRWEGTRTKVYKDTKNIDSIGVGLNLESSSAPKLIESVGANYQDVRSGKAVLTLNQVEVIYDVTWKAAYHDALKLVPNLESLPEFVQIVLVDLSFNLGYTKLAGFAHTLDCIKLGQYVNAAINLKNSAWFHEVGQRAFANVAVIGGSMPPEHFL